MWEVFHLEFMRNALIAGLLASVACGVVGTLVMVNRIVFIAGGIAHAAYGGIGLALFLGIPPSVGAGGFAVLVSMVMSVVSRKEKHRADTFIGVLWAVGFATGVILIDLAPGYQVDLMSYLFGSLLAVPSSDLWIMLGLNVLIVGTVGLLYPGFLALSFDEEFASVRGIPVSALYLLLLVLVALSVVMIIRVVGLILVIALLTIPPYLAELVCGSLKRMMGLSSLLSAGFVVVGLGISYRFNLSSGATVILVAAFVFGTVHVLRSLRSARKRGTRPASVPPDSGGR